MMNLNDRVKHYNEVFGNKYPASKLIYQGNFIVGVWMIGNFYKNSVGFYGCYPHGYLKRITNLFPDIEADEILHLFSGSLGLQDDIKGTTFDINPELNPDIVGDAHNLSEILDRKFKLIFADPAYSEEDSEHYGTPMINRNKVVKECVKVLEPNGFLVWLDQVYPMYRKIELKLVGTIGLIRSTNHRVRTIFIYRKVYKEKL